MTFTEATSTRLRGLLGLAGVLMLAACGGGDPSTSSVATPTTSSIVTTNPTPAPALTNFATVTVDAGPAALQQGSDGYLAANTAFVSVTVCVPGTSTCQTIDHVAVDTGSVGLRLLSTALNATMLSGLPQETDASANPVGECYGFVDGYAFGSVRQADFQIGGEAVASMPLQVVADTGRFASVPSKCSSGGGSAISTVKDLGANGIIGIGLTTSDCGASCTVSGGFGAAIYYDCPATGCASIVTRASTTSAPFQQIPNPVAAMSVDNNGTIISLPAPPAGGEASASGTLYFGIGTQTNNTLPSSATVLTTTGSSDAGGAGLLTAIYGGRTLVDSYIDSGSSAYFFVDSSITQCTSGDAKGFYCPSAAIVLSPTLKGRSGTTVAASFALMNANTLLQSDFAALPGLGANPNALSGLSPTPNSFDFGLPFFYGRNIYTAIEGRTAGAVQGPYIAF